MNQFLNKMEYSDNENNFEFDFESDFKEAESKFDFESIPGLPGLPPGMIFPIFYILNDNNEVIPCKNITLALSWRSNFSNCRVGLDTIGHYRISTVFLGISSSNCNFAEKDKCFFETMAFDDLEGENFTNIAFDPETDTQKAAKSVLGFDLAGNMRRYRTWKEAEAGHNEICRLFESVTGLNRVNQVDIEKE